MTACHLTTGIYTHQMETANRIRGKNNQAKGADGEAVAHRAMHNLGLQFIQPISTPYLITRGRNGNVISATPKMKVTGDLSAVGPNGVSVLAEVKRFDEDKLIYSRLENHQHEDLLKHHGCGGISLLIWVYQRQAIIMRYPITGFHPRTSIHIDDAKLLALSQDQLQ